MRCLLRTLQAYSNTVSYTHLRAHETLRYLVCRLLLEKKPKWNDEAAKKKLLEYFDLLGFNDPNVTEARKKLSSLMFK